MKKKITTLEELEKEQEKLKMTIQVTRQAFAENLDKNRHQLKGFFIKKIAIPGGAIGLGFAAVKKAAAMIGNDKPSQQQQQQQQQHNSSGLINKSLLLGLGFAQTYLAKWWATKDVKEDFKTDNSRPSNPLKKVI